MDNNQQQKFDRAIAYLLSLHAFWGSWAANFDTEKRIADSAVGTLATDGESIWYAPEYIESRSILEVAFDIAHEIEHVRRLHHIRMIGKDLENWNLATDNVINETLLKEQVGVASDYHFEKRFIGMPEEEIYKLLMDEGLKTEDQSQETSETEDSQDGEGESKSSSGKPKKEKQDSSSPENNDSEEGQGSEGEPFDTVSDNTENGDTENKCPGIPNDAEKNKETFKNGGVLPSRKSSSEIEADIRAQVSESLRYAEKAGQISDSMKTELENFLSPEISWKQIMREWIDEVTEDDYSYSYPSHIDADPYILPSLYDEGLKTLVFCVDVSYSMRRDIILQIMSELNELKSALQVNLFVLFVNTKVVEMKSYEPSQEIDKNIPLGGGTAFKPAFDYIEKNIHEEIAGVIYATDMEANLDFFSPHRTLWLDYGRRHPEPKFGKVIKIT